MQPGGDGLYYFYAHFRVNAPKFARLDIRRNGGVFCVVWEDERDGNDSPASSCGAVITLVEGCIFFRSLQALLVVDIRHFIYL